MAATIKRIGILISGRGSNMMALIEAIRRREISNAELAVVISDRRDAPGLQKAAAAGIETLVIERRGRSREEHDRDIVATLKTRNIDLVCLPATCGCFHLVSLTLIAAAS